MQGSFTKLAATAIWWALSVELALSQVAKPERASGPSSSDFVKDMTGWFANHQGAAVVFGVGAVVVVGMFIYNRVRPGS